MKNDFRGLLSSVHSDFKHIWTHAIDCMLEDTACTTPCLLLTEYDAQVQCPNCVYDPVTQRSRNIYNGTGPIPFTHGQCPYCHGWGIPNDESTAQVNLMVIWHYKDFIGFSVDWSSVKDNTLFIPFGYIQTLSKQNLFDQLRSAREILINTTVQNPVVAHRFSRVGEPNPMGLDSSTHIVTTWKRNG